MFKRGLYIILENDSYHISVTCIAAPGSTNKHSDLGSGLDLLGLLRECIVVTDPSTIFNPSGRTSTCIIWL